MARPSDFRSDNYGRTYEEVITELEERVRKLEDYVNWDEHLRAQYPALQDLYEKFQATKRLIVE